MENRVSPGRSCAMRALREGQNSISKGSSDTEVTELAVIAWTWPATSATTIVTPVANSPTISRNCLGSKLLCSSRSAAAPIERQCQDAAAGLCRPAPIPVRVADRPPDRRRGIHRTPGGRPALPGWDCADAGSRVPRRAPQSSPETGSDRLPRCSPDHPAARPWRRRQAAARHAAIGRSAAVRSTRPGCARGSRARVAISRTVTSCMVTCNCTLPPRSTSSSRTTATTASSPPRVCSWRSLSGPELLTISVRHGQFAATCDSCISSAWPNPRSGSGSPGRRQRVRDAPRGRDG